MKRSLPYRLGQWTARALFGLVLLALAAGCSYAAEHGYIQLGLAGTFVLGVIAQAVTRRTDD